MRNHGYVGMSSNVGLTFAFGPAAIAVIAAASVVSAGAAVTTGVLNYEASQRAADAARSLKNEQAAQLKADAAVRANAAAKAAGTGVTFGQADTKLLSATATGLGFGSGNAPTGLGRGSLAGS